VIPLQKCGVSDMISTKEMLSLKSLMSWYKSELQCFCFNSAWNVGAIINKLVVVVEVTVVALAAVLQLLN